MSTLRISLEKRTDGSVVLRIVRSDGSSTWQRHEGPRAMFFPHHDLTHYAVETELGFARGFYGLIAEGWDIEDTTGKGARGPLPDETAVVEHLVGWLDAERTSADRWTVVQLNQDATMFAAKFGRPTPASLAESDLERIRETLRGILRQWASTPPGSSLDLTFGDERARS